MARLLLAFILILLPLYSLPQIASGDRTDSGDKTVLRKAIGHLQTVPSGRALLKRAQHSWNFNSPSLLTTDNPELAEKLIEFLRWGETSRTDAVLTRQLDPKTGQESRRREVIIYLRPGQSLNDTILDLAHELIHATARPAWDPYDPGLTPGRYVQAAIEGEGGEIEAVAAECSVSMELASVLGSSQQRCWTYLTNKTNGRQRIEKQKILRDFYRVGKWHHELARRLGKETALFPVLSSNSPKLYSSTGNAPYPIALLDEYDDLNQVACENSRKRLEAFSGRTLATVTQTAEQLTTQFLNRRCRLF
ncbi:MAG TPA: hypothetical protein VJB59_09665 [Bdellovibrionota bacterium]|nr:hypothetical protein [Bdellovibrionota bacterium]